MLCHRVPKIVIEPRFDGNTLGICYPFWQLAVDALEKLKSKLERPCVLNDKQIELLDTVPFSVPLPSDKVREIVGSEHFREGEYTVLVAICCPNGEEVIWSVQRIKTESHLTTMRRIVSENPNGLSVEDAFGGLIPLIGEGAGTEYGVQTNMQIVCGNITTIHRNAIRQCASCGETGVAFQVCSLCGMRRYCSKECQAKHWKGGHRKRCSLEKVIWNSICQLVREIANASNR